MKNLFFEALTKAKQERRKSSSRSAHPLLKITSMVVLLLMVSVNVWGYNIPITHPTLVGVTQKAGNPTTVDSDASESTGSVTLYYTISSGYDPTDATITWSTASRTNMAYGYNWERITDTEYSLTLYNSSGKWGSGTGTKFVNVYLSLALLGVYEIEYSTNGCSGSVEGPASALPGATVNMTVTPGDGCELSTILAYDGELDEVSVTGSGTSWHFTMPNSEVVLEVQFTAAASTHSITYNRTKAACAQDGSGSWPANVSSVADGASYNSLPTDIELNGVDGYTFVGWTTESSTYVHGTSTLYTTSIASVTSDMTLYPVFSSGSSTGSSTTFSRITSTDVTAGYYIISNGQGGDNVVGGTITNDKLGNISISGGNGTSIPATDRLAMWQFEASGSYWTIKNRYTGQYMALSHSGSTINGNKIAMQAAVDNYAKWTISQFNANYHIISAADASYYLRLNNGVWDAHSGGNEQPKFLYKYATDPGAASTTYTITPECNTYTLTYNGNGATNGSVPAVATEYAAGTSVTVLGNSGELTKTGYDFNGWKADNASSGTAYAAGSSITMSANHTLYAQWLAHTINLTLYANNGGATSDGSASVKYDATALDASPTLVSEPTGKTLLGYYAAADGDLKVLNADGTFAENAVSGYITSSKWSRDVTPTELFAHWRDNSYTVVFNKNDNGGGATGTMSNQVFTYGVSQTLTANDFSWDAHSFEGWATASDGEVVYGDEESVNNLSAVDGATVNLYAVWTNKTYADYKFTCSDLTLANEDLSKVIWITTTAGQVVRSANPVFKISGSGLKPGAAITFTLGGNSANNTSDIFSFRAKDYSSIAAHAETGALAETEVYAFYNPTATTDGLDLNAVGTQIVATAAGGTSGGKTYMELTSTLANVAINGRHVPSQFVIAARIGKTWYALPGNITTNATQDPVMIGVDNSTNPTTAYCPANYGFRIVSLGSTNTNQSNNTANNAVDGRGFYTDGEKVKLGLQSNLPMFGSTTTTLGQGGTAASLYGGGYTYFWTLEHMNTSATAVSAVTYKIKTANSNTNPYIHLNRGQWKWGLYSSGVEEIRLLSISPIEELTLEVMEWGTNALAVKYTGGGTLTSVQIGDTDEDGATMSEIGGDLQRISGLSSLAAGENGKQCQQMLIQITESEVLKQKILQVPFIVTSDITTDDLRTWTGETGTANQDSVTYISDIVIRNGGKLTTSNAQGQFANLYIYPGGKADITYNIRFANVYLRGGFSWLGSPEFGLPRMRVASDKSITGIGTAGHGVYYDLYLNSDIYYMTALPKDVALSDIRNEEGTTDFKAWIKYYNGGNRAGVNTDKPWVSVTSGSLKRGVGYEIAIKKRNGRPYGILRFPLLKATTWSNETECNPDVTAWGMTAREPNEGVTANNAGWNLVGNPFMTAFHNSADDNIVNYGFTKHGNPWDGTYDWDKSGDEEKIKYFTIPEYTYEDWRDVRSIGATLEAFYPFAVQVKQDGKLAFAPANRDLKPSILRQKMAEREVMVDFELKDANGTTDVAGLTICNDYSAAFDSEDKEKTIKSNSYLKVYTMVGEYRTAFNSLPEADAAQPIPVGYIAPVAGSYTFALLEDGDYSTLEHLWLTDYETSKTVDLLTENYTFETAAGETNTRFALNAILKAEGVTTEIGDIEGADVLNMSVYGGNKHLVVRGLPSGADVWVYDAAGKLVATWTNVSDASVQTDVPASGVYSVRAIHNNTAVTKRAIVK